MKFGLNASEVLVLREALMSYRNRHTDANWREPHDAFRVAAADDLLGRLDAYGRIAWAEQDERMNAPAKDVP